MTEEKLRRFRTLHGTLERISKQYASMQSAYFVSDSVRGGEATDAGRGRVISVQGTGHAGLAKKLVRLETTAAEYKQEIIEVEDWYDALPETTAEDMNIKNIIYDYYFEGMSWKDIGAKLGYTGQGAAQKIKRYWCK
jgi:hypothetical protein